MPHGAASVIKGWVSQGVSPKTLSLSSAQATTLSEALSSDAHDLHYSAMVSLMDACHGLEAGLFSWATVKLYYVSFYAVRAILAINNTAIFHAEIRPGRFSEFSLNAKESATPSSERGPTHKTVWKVFETELMQNVLTTEIGADPSFAWMSALREQANYKEPRFSEPLVPVHFRNIGLTDLALDVERYWLDREYLLCFDPDHAAIAFPIACIRELQRFMYVAGSPIRRGSWLQLMKIAKRVGCKHSIRTILGTRPVYEANGTHT